MSGSLPSVAGQAACVLIESSFRSRHVVERSYGSFTRTFRLPDNVNISDCKTQFSNGVLELTFNKKPEEKKEPKRITIQ